MPALDTNVLVRHLVQDDAAQAAAAAALLRRAIDSGELLFVALTVSLELEWVLRSRYRVHKSDALSAFEGLLASRELQFQQEADESTTGPASFVAVDPDGNPILVDQHV